MQVSFDDNIMGELIFSCIHQSWSTSVSQNDNETGKFAISPPNSQHEDLSLKNDSSEGLRNDKKLKTNLSIQKSVLQQGNRKREAPRHITLGKKSIKKHRADVA